MLQNATGDAVAYIQYMKSQTKKRVRRDVKARTDEAFEIINHIYQNHRKTKSLDAIKQLVHDALFAASWDDGRGYYFAEDMQGTEVINRNNPELEGTNVSDFQDSKGNFIMREILRVVKESGEGFSGMLYPMTGNLAELSSFSGAILNLIGGFVNAVFPLVMDVDAARTVTALARDRRLDALFAAHETDEVAAVAGA